MPWYADDGAAADKLQDFFRRLCELGPTYGYFPEENKSILIVRSKDTVKAVNFRIGNDGNFKIMNGFRYLGSFIGEKKLEKEWIKGKINDWILAVESVAELTKYAP